MGAHWLWLPRGSSNMQKTLCMGLGHVDDMLTMKNFADRKRIMSHLRMLSSVTHNLAGLLDIKSSHIKTYVVVMP